MTSPLTFLTFGGAALIAGSLFTATVYQKGARSCAPSYEAKILKAQAKNREIATKYYQSQSEYDKQLAADATKDAVAWKAKYNVIKNALDSLPVVPDDDFIDGAFLRGLSGL